MITIQTSRGPVRFHSIGKPIVSIETSAPPAPTKGAILSALRAFVSQRSGLDCRNYGDRESLTGDYRPILRDGRTARCLLRQIELRESITAENLADACKRAFSGRLSLVIKPNGSVAVDYCTGQYFAVEYRKAVCAVCASAFWAYFRENMPPLEVANAPEGCPQVAQGIVNAGEYIRKQAKREFGRAIASRWFN